MTFTRNRTRKGAFTILEMITALTLLSIIAAGIFGIIDAGVNATMELTVQQRRSQEFLGLQHLLRSTLRELPADVAVQSGEEDAPGVDGIPQLILRGATGVLDWSPSPIFDADVVITTRKQPGGLRTLTVYHLDPEENATEEFDLTKAVRQLDLISDLKEVTFRYYYGRGDRWFEAWRAGGPRPDLIEMNVLAAEDEEPRRYVFYMPPLVAPGQLPNAIQGDDDNEEGDDDEDDDEGDNNNNNGNNDGVRRITRPAPQS